MIKRMRGAGVFLVVTAAELGVLGALGLHARMRQAGAGTSLRPCIEQVEAWSLTDLCLFTEARYTRHPAMADDHAAFQDHPTALEHFPSGTLMPPPWRTHARTP